MINTTTSPKSKKCSHGYQRPVSYHNKIQPTLSLCIILGIHRQIFDIRRIKFQNSNVCRLASQLSLCDLLQPGVKLRMKMYLEQRRQAMLQLHLNDQQCCFLLRCDVYYRFDLITATPFISVCILKWHFLWHLHKCHEVPYHKLNWKSHLLLVIRGSQDPSKYTYDAKVWHGTVPRHGRIMTLRFPACNTIKNRTYEHSQCQEGIWAIYPFINNQ